MTNKAIMLFMEKKPLKFFSATSGPIALKFDM